jgi:uncharacterized membrane protein YsdA (DUF1294 family)/cold shock CspA family protein
MAQQGMQTGVQAGPQVGTVERWDEARGFGFIRSADARLFFHVRDFRSDGRPPAPGMVVNFERIDVGGKGPRGVAVRPQVSARGEIRAQAPDRHSVRRLAPRREAVARHAPARSPDRVGFMLVLMALYAAAVLWAIWTARLSVAALFVLPLLSAITFFVYWTDKYAARRGAWRTSESTLHLLSLLGGWPGAWWAQQLLRHKSVKPAFRATYWATVALHLLAMAAWVALGPWRPLLP